MNWSQRAMTSNEEEAIIRAFLMPSKCDRFLEMLANPKRRNKATAELAHFKWLDPRWVVPIPSNQQHPSSISQILRSHGAGDTCLVISEDASLDGQHFALLEALKKVVGIGMGSMLSCIPGQLAYFEGEGPSDRCILSRRAI
jgi:hypothetical protein